MEVLKDMGMTDKQFNGFIRFLIDDLKEAKDEKDTEKKDKRIQKILENLQSTLEDQIIVIAVTCHTAIFLFIIQLVVYNICQLCMWYLYMVYWYIDSMIYMLQYVYNYASSMYINSVYCY